MLKVGYLKYRGVHWLEYFETGIVLVLYTGYLID